jgi:hypothetical protein
MRFVAFAGKRPAQFKWLIRAAVVLVIYTLAGFFLLPAIIKWQMLKRLPAITKRAVAIKQVKFNPYALSLTIRGFALTEPDGSVFSSFDELYVNFQLSSIFRWKWTFAEISLKKPFAQVTYRPDGTFNFANLLQNSQTPQPSKPKAPSGPPPLLVFQMSITNGLVAFSDLNRPTPFHTRFTPIDLSLTNLTTVRDKNSPYSFIARTGEGEVFAWSGRVTVNPLGSAGTFRLGGLKLPKYAPYARDYALFQIANGLLDVAADYRYDSQTNALDLVVSNAVVHLIHLELKASDTGETIVSIPALAVENAEASVARQTASVGRIRSDAGFVLVRQAKDGSINLLLQLVPPAKAANAPVKTNAAPPWVAKIDEIDFDNYSIKVEDQKPAKPAAFNIDQLAFTLKGVSNQSNAPVTTKLSMRFQETGAIGLAGMLTLMPPSADMQVTVSNLDLRVAQPYVEEQVKLVLTGGAMDVHGHARFAPPEPGMSRLSFNGDVAISNFATTDDVLFKDFAKWETLSLNGVKLAVQPDSLHVDQIKFTGLDTSLVIGPDKRPNLQTILRKEIAAGPTGGDTNAPQPLASASTNAVIATAAINSGPSPASAAKMKLPDISVGTLALENSSIHFSDQSLEPHCSFVIEQFGGTIQGLSSKPDTTATVDVHGKVDARSPFSVTGKVNPLSQDLFADITVTFTNTELISFTPYTEKFAGRPLEKGKLSFAVHYLVKGKDVKAENGFFVDQLTLGAKNNSPDATKLPVKLAIALLKDRNGRIQLDVPVQGRIDDPKFSYGPIVWHVVMNLIEKAALSPFSLLGAAFGGGEELSFVDFQPGQTGFIGSETNKLDKLAKALYERPELTVEIRGGVDPAPDRESLARIRLDEQVKAAWLKDEGGKTNARLEDIQLDPKVYERLVRKIYRKEIGSYHPTEVPPGQGTNAPTGSVLPAVAKTSQPAAGAREGNSGEPEHGASLLMAPVKPPKRVTVVRRTIPSASAANPGAQPVVTELTPREAELADMEDQLTKRIQITDDDLRDLMQARGNKVQAYLLQTGKVTAERLFIIAPKPVDAAAKGQSRVTMSLD